MLDHRNVPTPPLNGHSNGSSTATESTDFEQMLIDEGLELLQAFRSIKSREVRTWIRRIVDMIAAEGKS